MSTFIELLTIEEMRRADELAVASGVPSLTLMENAGRAVADAAAGMLPHRGRIAVLCGPGNNGGDGFVAARHLKARGYDVAVALWGSRESLRGDAAEMAGRWEGEVLSASPAALEGAALIIDALFGSGLKRPLDGAATEIVTAANESGSPILAVDVPSGLDGDTGAANGPVIQATRTVTFFRRKPGHLLLPGRALCGKLTVADIGIPASVLDEIKPQTFVNAPELWRAHYPWPKVDGHKYGRGHAVVVSGPAESTGAARLGARGALRIGAGLVTVASPPGAAAANAAHLTAIMLARFDDAAGLAGILADTRKSAVLVGPGLGAGEAAAEQVNAALRSGASLVLDADALTTIATPPEGPEGHFHSHLLFVRAARSRPIVVTPHDGEYERMFGANTESSDRLSRARDAAYTLGAVVVLKGADTVIAAPYSRAAINENAPPWLATAGSGDVLAGFITGLLAQKMSAFEAACAAVWLHGECANAFGPGLIAEDLPETLPGILRNLRDQTRRPE